MAFQIQCDNKKCFKLQAAKLDITTNAVICDECGGNITNVTEFAKRQLKALGQTTKHIQQKDSYSIKCASCEISGMPLLEKDKFICKGCKNELTNISDTFKVLLRGVLNHG